MNFGNAEGQSNPESFGSSTAPIRVARSERSDGRGELLEMLGISLPCQKVGAVGIWFAQVLFSDSLLVRPGLVPVGHRFGVLARVAL